MKTRPFIGLLIVLAVLGGLALKYGWVARHQARAAHQVFTAVHSDQVSDVIFMTDEKLRLLRKPDGWRIIEPVNVRADETKIEQLVARLASLKYTQVLAGPRREYQLEPFLEFATNRNRYTLKLGATTPAGRYIATAEHVYLIKPAPELDLKPSVEILRNRRLSLAKPAEIEQIRVTSPDFKLHLERRDSWQVAGQAWQRLDPFKVEALIAGLIQGEALAFERDIQGREPDVKLEFITGDAHSEIFRIWFGCPVFAEVPAIDGVVEIDPELMRLIPDSVNDLVDRALIKPEARRIKSLRLSSGPRRLNIVRDEQGFRCARGAIKPVHIGRLLANLRRLEGEDYADPQACAARPLSTITVYYSSKKPAFDIRIYSNYYLALDGRTYRVRPQDHKALQTTVSALIDEYL